MLWPPRWAPLLYRALQGRMDQVPAAWREALLSADLTARVRHGNLVGTANEIIDTCQDLRVDVTLLKGISISDQHYPAAHLRPMGDIDVLVPKHARESVESKLRRRGYRPKAGDEIDDDSYHGVPLFHPERRVWVEVHTAPFPESTSLRSNRTFFSQPHMANQSLASTFHGRPAYRLTDELQLVYLASYWARGLLIRASPYHSFTPSTSLGHRVERCIGTHC